MTNGQARLTGALAAIAVAFSPSRAAEQDHRHHAHGSAARPSADGSGTAWLPASSVFPGISGTIGGWRGMLHYDVTFAVARQGSRQSGTEGVATNWFMGILDRDLGGGTLSLRGMASLEPYLQKRDGYPVLLQTGETAYGRALVDRQHPHDLVMELAARWTRPLGARTALDLYVAPAGEPALGPVAFPHRPSTGGDPVAPLGHHWLDSSHIAFGVVTAGISHGRVKGEVSWFNGREPDEERTDLDLREPDSWSARVAFSPSRDWTVQVSQGRLSEPERLEPGRDLRRTTASISWNRPLDGGYAAATLAWGRNELDGAPANDAVLLEAALVRGANTWFGRAERVEKSGHDFDLDGGHDHGPLPVGAVSLGYARRVARIGATDVGLGARASLGFVGRSLREHRYDTRRPASAVLYLQFRPAGL